MSLYGEQPAKERQDEPDSLFEYVARHNGPLEDYNPQMILQCLLWGNPALLYHYGLHADVDVQIRSKL